ncbi:hypothetical protein AVI51_11300 [Piscirickettsia salmonis]|uniref:Uncharacterized protein n=1 Tax=Piscirickettsia salmonis TaxID=1238 RepID=A0A9Q5VFG9_PISSA|nr:type III secretion system protein [Piscirickettsia salmonis]APS43827.1 hypothetical protein AVI48_05200 [Piscirickettsia salmonis]APS47181.1 hypothetical protein AVI49_05800 [Piscirickettsia salmonis]APS51378.1 hypothetical protein AVI50_11415 [Piscirickettsia salmonis]APS54588.1 hypothetical protein AVI51_11300 [Piscirickettsia salmonis]
MAGGYLQTFRTDRTGSESMHGSTESGVSQCMELVNERMVSGDQKNKFTSSASTSIFFDHSQGEGTGNSQSHDGPTTRSDFG